MSTALADYQFQLGETGGLVFGDGTVFGTGPPSISPAGVRTQDSPVPLGDGVRMGRDYRGGRRWTFDFKIVAADVFDKLGALEAAWLADEVRTREGEAAVLRYRRAGQTRRVLGRPRKFAPVLDHAPAGYGLATGVFDTVDHLHYLDDPVRVITGIYGLSDTGLAGPWTDPLHDSGTAQERPGNVDVPGDLPTRLIEVIFTGPATNPGVEIVGVGSLTLRTTLASEDQVTLLVHPSLRAALINGSGDISGVVAGDVDGFALPPGQQQVRYLAENLSGESEMTFTAWPACASY